MIRVLLVDDHALVRAGIHSLLQGMREVQVVAEASSGEEALEVADRERPDVVLMDIAMKGITGLESAAQMRERCPEVRVVILSMHSGEEYVLQALRAGAVGYLLKPINRERLAAATLKEIVRWPPCTRSTTRSSARRCSTPRSRSIPARWSPPSPAR